VNFWRHCLATLRSFFIRCSNSHISWTVLLPSNFQQMPVQLSKPNYKARTLQEVPKSSKRCETLDASGLEIIGPRPGSITSELQNGVLEKTN
jgi:hypothetical protein